MNALPPSSVGPPQLQQALRPFAPATSSFWRTDNVHKHVENLRESADLLRSLHKELEGILVLRSSRQGSAEGDDVLCKEGMLSSEESNVQINEIINTKKITLDMQESLSLEAAKSLFSAVQNQLLPFSVITSQAASWEEKSTAVSLAQKLQKSKRNKRWKKRKRRRVAEMLRKEREDYDKADQDADEWRAREIAKDIAKRKIEKMKAIAKLKAIEDRKRLESELELVLVVEKLQELHSIRIQKLKKQGHFLPEEDDKFLERVRAAVEEEERQVVAAADTVTAKNAITTAEETRKGVQSANIEAENAKQQDDTTVKQDQANGMESESRSCEDVKLDSETQEVGRQRQVGGYDSVANLPYEFYHYYHGSSNDMGTLIEVRRVWDAYLRPGGSRIPGHWVQPPQPADEIWASYLVRPSS